MNEHEQGQQPWTDEQLDRLARNLTWRAGGSTENAMRIGLRVGRDAWQADRDALQAKLDEERGIAGHLEDRARQLAWDNENLKERVEAWQPQQPLDIPDGAGWWAFEGRWRGSDSVGTFNDVVEIVESDGELIPADDDTYYPFETLDAKWTRLHMPWDSTP